MKYTQRRNFKLMLLMIIVVWLLAGLISIPPLFGWGKPSARLQREYVCSVSDDLKYQIYATLLAFYLPLIVMIIIYLNIFRAARKIKKREMETAGRIKYNPSFSPEYQLEQLIKRNKLANGTIKSSCTSRSKASILCCKKFKKNDKENPLTEESKSNETIQSVNMRLNVSYGNIDKADGRRNSNVKKLSNFIYSHFSGKRNSGLSSSGKNQKATKTLGVIMGCFILCWLPFFILAVFKPIPLGNGFYVASYIPKWLDSLLLWLGYFNSALNPMIYARFNREFRRPFVEILCFRCKGINDKLRDEERKKMYASDTNFSNHNSQFIPTNYSSSNLKSIAQVDANNNLSKSKTENVLDESSAIKIEVSDENNNAHIDLNSDAIKKLLKQEKNKFFFGTAESPNSSFSDMGKFYSANIEQNAQENLNQNDFNNNLNQQENR